MRHLVALLLTFAAGAVVARPMPPEIREDLTYLESFVRQDPVLDAQASIQRGNLRLLGVAGFVLHVPGVDEALLKCPAIFEEVDVIRGTSDVVWGEKHMVLIRKATAYAVRYNQLISKHRQFKFPPNCGVP